MGIVLGALLVSSGRVKGAEGRLELEPMDFRGVTLEPGLLSRQLDGVKDFYLAIPNDDLLRGFRLRAGKPAPGNEMGGWYSDDLYHVFGQIIAGLSRLHAATGDPACKQKVHDLIAGWAACIEPDGFFYYSKTPKSPHYTYDKMVGGLVDAHLYASDPQALPALRRITEWAVKHLDRTKACPTELNANADEWYTLSENLYRAYLATGQRETIYRDFAKVWEYSEYWDLYAKGTNLFDARCGEKPRTYHAYSHVNTLCGAAAAYLVSGEKHYLDCIVNAAKVLQNGQCLPTGGYGPDEHFFPPEPLDDVVARTHATFETQCGSWAAFKLCKYLICFTGDAQYGDCVEPLVYNGISASIPTGKDGRVFYYSDYNPGGATKVLHPTPWTCCTGTRPCAVADYCDLIYFHRPDEICVNLYTPSTVRFTAAGKRVILHQETTFPEANTVKLTVEADEPVEFRLALRNPSWLKGPAVFRLNDQPVDMQAGRLHWLNLKRTWRTGDRVELQLPMVPVPTRGPSTSRLFAVTVGPVVLAATNADHVALDPAKLAGELQPVGGKALTYRLAAASAAELKPLYAIPGGEKYLALFHDPTPPPAARLTPPTKTSLQFLPGSTVKLEQLVGEFDKERHSPTLSRTFSRFGVQGTDLGYSFEHEGRAYFLFGDTIGHVSVAEDTMATTDAVDPEKGVKLDFLMKGGKYLVIDPPGVSMGAFETPVGGISLGDKIYVVVRTDHSEDWSKDRAVLTRFIPPAEFKVIRTLSAPPAARFITTSLHARPGEKAVQGTPPGGPYVFLWGTGAYRKSDVYLCIVPEAHFETGQGTYYFAGIDERGAPIWRDQQKDAAPIVKNGTLGDVSVTWCKDLSLWLMTYDRAKPTDCVAFAYSRTPWGPWSEPQEIFKPVRDGAMGKFIHDPRASPPDGLAGPVIGKPKEQWEGTFGGFYAPYVIERFTKVTGSELSIHYCLSTWNPYVVVLMKSKLQITQVSP